MTETILSILFILSKIFRNYSTRLSKNPNRACVADPFLLKDATIFIGGKICENSQNTQPGEKVMLRHSTLYMLVATIALLVATEKNAFGVPKLDAETIKAGLRTTHIEEDGFVEEAVDMAKVGELPWAMVDNTFSWAKRKPKNRFQYFRKALIELASRKGITIPRPVKPVAIPKKSPFFIQKLNDFFAALKGATSKIPIIGKKY